MIIYVYDQHFYTELYDSYQKFMGETIEILGGIQLQTPPPRSPKTRAEVQVQQTAVLYTGKDLLLITGASEMDGNEGCWDDF